MAHVDNIPETKGDLPEVNRVVSEIKLPKKLKTRDFNEPLCHKEVLRKRSNSDTSCKCFKEYKNKRNLPLAMKTLFGFNSEIFAKNLTSDDRNKIVITSGNLLSFYDFEYDTHNILQVHKNKILSVSVEVPGHFFVTTDMGKDSRIIIWDTEKSLPVHIIKNFNGNGCPFAKLSPCAKYLLTVVEKQSNKDIKLLSLWEWIYRRENPDVTIEVDSAEYGCLKKVDFCIDNCAYLILTTEKGVVFLTFADKIPSEYYKNVVEKLRKGIKKYSRIKEKDKHPARQICTKRPTVKIKCQAKKAANLMKTWNQLKINKTKKFLVYIPKDLHKIKNAGTYLDSAYVRGTRMAISGTSTGNIIVWSDVGMAGHFYDAQKIPQNELSNRKNFLLQLCLDPYPIQLIYNIDSFIATVNSKGQIGFYNNQLIPVFKIQDLGSNAPVNISFNLTQRGKKYKMTPAEHCEAKERYFLMNHSVGPEKVPVTRKMYKHEKPDAKVKNKENLNSFVFDATKNLKRRKVEKWKKAQDLVYCLHDSNEIFDVRDFIITTTQGDVMYVNVTHENVYEILRNYYYDVSCLDTHPLQEYLCIGTSYGKLLLLDYNTHMTIKERSIDLHTILKDSNIDPKDEELIKTILNITYIKYSPDGHWFACGTEHGDVWILSGLSLHLEMRIKKTKFPVLKMMFSNNNDFFAFYDNGRYLFLYKTVRNEDRKSLKFMYRVRAHYKPVTDIAFLSTNEGTDLFSIAEDGYLIKYSTDDCIEVDSAKVKGSIMLEEFGVPTCLKPALHCPKTLMVFNSETKCKYIDTESMTLMCTKQAPPSGPVSIAQFFTLKHSNESFVLFGANNDVGLMKLPVDGNPFRVVCSSSGSQKVVSACVGHGGKFGFSLAQGMHIIMWEINIDALNKFEAMGGEGMTPFMLALDADPNSMSVTDMEALYKVILLASSGVTTTKPRLYEDTLPLFAVPNFFRSLGFFPSSNEEKAAINELLVTEEQAGSEKRVTFDECIKLFYNHRTKRFSECQLKKAFENICKKAKSRQNSDRPHITLQNLANILQENGEKFTPCQTLNYLRALVNPLTKDEEWDILIRNKALDEIPEKLLLPTVSQFMPNLIEYPHFKQLLLGTEDDQSTSRNIKYCPIFTKDVSGKISSKQHSGESSNKKNETVAIGLKNDQQQRKIYLNKINSA